MEIPSLNQLQDHYAEQGLVVLGVSIDEGSPTAVRQFAQKAGIRYPVLMANDATLKAFGGVEAIPTSFVIDRSGRIAAKHVGLADKAAFEESIKPLLIP
jgi:peroxiredoxin